jgi:hypothetical protein
MEWLSEAWTSFLTLNTQLLLAIAFMLFTLERTVKLQLDRLIEAQQETNERLKQRPPNG